MPFNTNKNQGGLTQILFGVITMRVLQEHDLSSM